jgi:molybdopterin synthase sulfur carrier subunit
LTLLVLLLVLVLLVLILLLVLVSFRLHPMIRVILPAHLRTLAGIDREIQLDVSPPVTQRSVLDALEARLPMLCGTIRDHVTKQRRPLVRFFACAEDLSHESPDALLPEKVAAGAEPYVIIGAIAGG